MVSKQNAQSLVASAFPGRESLVERCYRESNSFRDLCRDYRNCAAALESWRASDDAVSSSRAREYGELLAALAQELEAWLGSTAGGPKPGSRGASE